MPKLDITSKERSSLRATAHPLHPVVQIGDRGLSESVLKEIDVNLNAHHLIKIRVAGQERDARDAMLETICDRLSCAPVHHLGKTLIVYRPDPNAAPAKDSSPMPTRALRDPSKPYTPKKQAATGATRTRRTERARHAAKKAESGDTPVAARARRAPARAMTHGIMRRSGSALSLKAGARRGPIKRG
jgi:RNA-binding protein